MHIPDGFIPIWQCIIIYIILMLIACVFTLKWLIESLIKLEKETPNTWKIITYIILVIFVLPSFVFFLYRHLTSPCPTEPAYT